MNSNSNLSNSVFKKIIDSRIISESSLSSKIFTALIFVGIFTKLYFSKLTNKNNSDFGPATALIWGYSIVIFSLLSIVFLNTVTGTDEDYQSLSNIFKFFSIPMLLLILLLMWEILLNFRYKEKLNKKEVPETYYKFSRYSSFLIILQVLMTVFQYSMNLFLKEKNETMSLETTRFVGKVNFINYVIIAINLFLMAIQQIILDNFDVDGDDSNN